MYRSRPIYYDYFINTTHDFNDIDGALSFLKQKKEKTDVLYFKPSDIIILPNNRTRGGLRLYQLPIVQIIHWTLHILVKQQKTLTFEDAIRLYNYGLAIAPYRVNGCRYIVDREEKAIRGILSSRRKYYPLADLLEILASESLVQDHYDFISIQVRGSVLSTILKNKTNKEKIIKCLMNEAAQEVTTVEVYNRKKIRTKRYKFVSAPKALPRIITYCFG